MQTDQSTQRTKQANQQGRGGSMTTAFDLTWMDSELNANRSIGSQQTIGLCYKLPDIQLPKELTAAERRIVWGLMGGGSNQQIALGHGVSIRTIAVQLQQLFDKFNVSSRHELLATLLRSSGDNLHADHLAKHARFTGDVEVFEGGRLLSDALPIPERSANASATGPNAYSVWSGILGGKLGLLSSRTLGDVRFLLLTDRAPLDEKSLREICLQPWDLPLLKGLGSGKSNQRLAAELCMSEPSLSGWTKRGLAKLGLTHRAELIRLLSTPS
jgi:DNA-binding CsgD family transcriptional regulator